MFPTWANMIYLYKNILNGNTHHKWYTNSQIWEFSKSQFLFKMVSPLKYDNLTQRIISQLVCCGDLEVTGSNPTTRLETFRVGLVEFRHRRIWYNCSWVKLWHDKLVTTIIYNKSKLGSWVKLWHDKLTAMDTARIFSSLVWWMVGIN